MAANRRGHTQQPTNQKQVTIVEDSRERWCDHRGGDSIILVAIEWGVCKLKNEIIIIILFYGSSSSRCHHHRPLLSLSEEIKSQLLSTT